MKEGEGLDHLAIAWKYPGQELQVIPAVYSKTTGPSTYHENIPVYALTTTIPSNQPVNCSIDFYCGAILETWTGIVGVSNNDLMYYTNDLTSNQPRQSVCGISWRCLTIPMSITVITCMAG